MVVTVVEMSTLKGRLGLRGTEVERGEAIGEGDRPGGRAVGGKRVLYCITADRERVRVEPAHNSTNIMYMHTR